MQTESAQNHPPFEGGPCGCKPSRHGPFFRSSSDLRALRVFLGGPQPKHLEDQRSSKSTPAVGFEPRCSSKSTTAVGFEARGGEREPRAHTRRTRTPGN